MGWGRRRAGRRTWSSLMGRLGSWAGKLPRAVGFRRSVPTVAASFGSTGRPRPLLGDSGA
jgi:hypothetical protein